MTIVFVSNFYTHHQSAFSEAAFRLTNGEYRFIATETMDEERLRMGWGCDNPSFVVDYRQDPNAARKLIDEADVAIYGSAPEALMQNRLNAKKLTFRYSERVYKRRCKLYELPARALKYYWRWGRRKSLFLLAASAYAASDYAMTGTFVGRAYKWGYFPKVVELDLDELFARKRENKRVSLLWCARFLDWKRPDAAIRLAKKLQDAGCDFELNLIGIGEMEAEIRQAIADAGLHDRVKMLGAMKPEQVREHMERADVFLFTSDRNEGWGAVLNESMNAGCAVVAYREIGSVPFLMKNGENGFVYNTEGEFFQYVKKLVADRELREKLGEAAYRTMIDEWNADVAAERLLTLIDALKTNGKCDAFQDGPCGVANDSFVKRSFISLGKFNDKGRVE